MGTMEITEINQKQLSLLDIKQLQAFIDIFKGVSNPKAKKIVRDLSLELRGRKNEEVAEASVKDIIKSLKASAKKIGGIIDKVMNDAEFQKAYAKYIDNPNDKNRLKKIQDYTNGMFGDMTESTQMKKLRIEKVCSIALGKDFNKDFIYEDVDFTKPSVIREAYTKFIDENRAIVYNPKGIKRFIKQAEKKFPQYKGEIEQLEDDEIIFPNDPKLINFFKGAREVKFVLKDSVEEASDKELDIKSLKDLIKNPSPKMIKQYGGKDKYIKMLKSKLAKLEATELDEAIKSWEVIVIKPVNKLKKNQKVVVKAANTVTAIKKAAKLFKIDDKLITGKVDVKLKESTELEEAKKVIAQVELWNGKKMKKSFPNQSSAERFIKKIQDEEDVRGYNLYAEGLEEASEKQLLIKDLKMLIDKPDPRMVKMYGGGKKYVDMLKKKLAKLESIEEATAAQLSKLTKQDILDLLNAFKGVTRAKKTISMLNRELALRKNESVEIEESKALDKLKFKGSDKKDAAATVYIIKRGDTPKDIARMFKKLKTPSQEAIMTALGDKSSKDYLQKGKLLSALISIFDEVDPKGLDGRSKAFREKVRKLEYNKKQSLPYQVFEKKVVKEKKLDALQKKADKTGIPYGILKQVFNRGVAAWRTGHRPGTNPTQWGYARVNSFATKSKGTWGGADKDLAAKVRAKG